MSALLSRHLIQTLQIRKDVARLYVQRDLLATGGQSFPSLGALKFITGVVFYKPSGFSSFRFVEPTNLFLKNSGGVNRTDKRLLTRPEKNCKRSFGMTQEAKAS